MATITKVSLTGPNMGTLHAVESDPDVVKVLADGMWIYRRWTFDSDTHEYLSDERSDCYGNIDIERERESSEYLAWEEAGLAVAEGRATELVHCYLCHSEAMGRAYHPDSDTGPLVGIIKTSTCNPADPTAAYHLSCGHVII